MTLGLKDLYYAVCTEADGAESYGTPKKMAEAMSADLSVKTADGSLYADDTLSESVTEFASGTLKLGIKDLTPEVLAELLGQEVDENSVVWAVKSASISGVLNLMLSPLVSYFSDGTLNFALSSHT